MSFRTNAGFSVQRFLKKVDIRVKMWTFELFLVVDITFSWIVLFCLIFNEDNEIHFFKRR